MPSFTVLYEASFLQRVESMRYHALACDYDGTLAHRGRVDDGTLAALERVRSSGRKLLLVSGRELDDLARVFPRLDLFDRLVLENGAVVVDPNTRDVRTLAEPPPPAFVQALEARGVGPISTGHVIVATWEPHERAVLDVIRDLGLELQVIFNKGAVMVLPSGVNKASGLSSALMELGLSAHNVVGVGDAENDHAFLSACECGVAVANALPMLKERADWVAPGDHGLGVQSLVDALVADDLAGVPTAGRHTLVLGKEASGAELRLSPHTAPVLIAGTSGAGKSTLATALLEQLADHEYQFCVIDPEGDYSELEGVAVLGDAKRTPPPSEILEVLAKPGESVVANLVGTPLADRPALFLALFAKLLEHRARTGRPHWIVLDETHHLLPETLEASTLLLPRDPTGLLLLTVHPEKIARELLEKVGTVIAIGASPRETVESFTKSIGIDAPHVPADPLAAGHALAWLRADASDRGMIAFEASPSTGEHHRHLRKYATGDLGEDRSFYFRGPKGRLKLRAQNLEVFLQMAEGVDDETWRFHLESGDIARWFRENIKDAELAEAAEVVQKTQGLAAADSRGEIREAIEKRYTAPA